MTWEEFGCKSLRSIERHHRHVAPRHQPPPALAAKRERDFVAGFIGTTMRPTNSSRKLAKIFQLFRKTPARPLDDFARVQAITARP